MLRRRRSAISAKSVWDFSGAVESVLEMVLQRWPKAQMVARTFWSIGILRDQYLRRWRIVRAAKLCFEAESGQGSRDQFILSSATTELYTGFRAPRDRPTDRLAMLPSCDGVRLYALAPIFMAAICMHIACPVWRLRGAQLRWPMSFRLSLAASDCSNAEVLQSLVFFLAKELGRGNFPLSGWDVITLGCIVTTFCLYPHFHRSSPTPLLCLESCVRERSPIPEDELILLVS